MDATGPARQRKCTAAAIEKDLSVFGEKVVIHRRILPRDEGRISDTFLYVVDSAVM